MIKFIITLIAINLGMCTLAKAQAEKPKVEFKKETILKEFSEKACNCIDSLEQFNKTKLDLTTEMGMCIDKNVSPYHMALSMYKLVDEMQKNTISQIEGKQANKKTSMYWR